MNEMFGINKLSKMEFLFYDSEAMESPDPKKVVAMYNPNTLSLSYENSHDPGQEIAKGITDQKFSTRNPRSLTVKLTFDGTGASPSSRGSLIKDLGADLKSKIAKGTSVNEENDIHKKINEFLKHAYFIKDTKHIPRYIAVVWGKMYFPCVLGSASVTYNLFRPDGVPLRGELSLTLKEHITSKQFNNATRLLSPDLTKSYIVKEGDRLDALCAQMYEDSSLYREVARVNNLKNHRKLIPGQSLIFPPIDKRV